MSDPRVVTIAFAGDTTNIDLIQKKLSADLKKLGLEIENVSLKIGNVFTQVREDKTTKEVANVRVEVKGLAKDATEAAKALTGLNKLNLEQGSSLGLRRIKVSRPGETTSSLDTAARKEIEKREKIQKQLETFDEKFAENKRQRLQAMAVREAQRQYNFEKTVILRRQEQELQLERKYAAELAAVRARIADPTDKFNIGSAIAVQNSLLRRYEAEREQIRKTAEEDVKRHKHILSLIKETQDNLRKLYNERQARAIAEAKRNRQAAIDYRNWWQQTLEAISARQAKIFSNVSAQKVQATKTEALTSNSNTLVVMRAAVAQQEIDIEQRKTQKLLGLEIALQKGKIDLVKANKYRDVILQNYSQELKDLQDQKNKLRALEVKSTKSAGGYGNAFTSLASRIVEVNLLWNAVNRLNLAISNAVGSIIPLGIQLDAVKASLQSTAGGTANATEILSALSEEAKRTGLSLGDLRSNFKLFQASTSLAGASLEKTWKMFTDLNTVSAALHLTSDQTNSIFLAMAQIFNKGKVQAEELVRQLGNLLPGAFASFAAANKKTTQQLMEDMEAGRVMAQDTMENFTSYMATKFSGAFSTASQALNADIGRMNSEFVKLGEQLYQLVRGPVQDFIQQLTATASYIQKNIVGTTDFNKILGILSATINTVAITALTMMGVKLTSLASNVLEFKNVTAFLRNPVVWVTAINAIIQSISELTDYFKKGQIAARDFLEEQLKLDRIAKAQLQPVELRVTNSVENSAEVTKFKQAIDNAKAELDKIKNATPSEFSLTLSFSTKGREELNKQIEELRTNLQLTQKELPALSDTDLPEVRQKKLITFYQAQIDYLQRKLDLNRQNLTQEKQQFELEQEKARTESEFGATPRTKDIDVINAKIAAAENRKEVAQSKNDFKEIAAINKELLVLEQQKLEATKKGSEALEQFKKVQEALEILGKRAIEKGLNNAEAQKRNELMKEYGRLLTIVKSNEAAANAEYVKNTERLKQREAAQVRKQLPELDAEAKTKIEQVKTLLKEEETAYKNNERTVYQYYTNVTTLRKAAIETEIAARQKKIDLLKDQPEARDVELEKVKQLQQEIETMREEVNQNFQRDLKNINSLVDEINVRYLESVGKFGEAGLEKARSSTAEQIKMLEAIKAAAEAPPEESIIDKNTESGKKFLEVAQKAAGALEKLRALSYNDQAEGFFKEFNDKAQFLDKELAIKEIILRTKQKSGAVTDFGALVEREGFLKEFAAKKQAELQILKEHLNSAEGAQDAASQENVARWRQEYEEKKAILDEFLAESNLMAQRFQTIFVDAFGTAFANFVTGTQTASEAFKSFAKDVIGSLAQIAAQEFAKQIFGFITSAFSIATSAFSGGAGIAASATSAIDPTGGYPFITSAKGNVVNRTETDSFFDQFKNQFNFASGGIPEIGSVKQSFMMANGAVGTLRERGPEAILPLQRDSKGNLGVSTVTKKEENNGLNIGNIQINVENKKDQSGPELANTIAETLVRRLADEQIQKASRPGNLLNKTTRFGNG